MLFMGPKKFWTRYLRAQNLIRPLLYFAFKTFVALKKISRPQNLFLQVIYDLKIVLTYKLYWIQNLFWNTNFQTQYLYQT